MKEHSLTQILVIKWFTLETEIFINSYIVEWIRAWNGNMDLSPCLSYHEVITYISDYFAKDDTGLMEVISAFLKQISSEHLKDRMKLVANTFLTHRQIGEAEAIYRLLPNMVMKNSNIACQWLSVGKRQELSKRWKLATKEEVESGKGLIAIEDREGYWIEQQDMLSKYLRRPSEIEALSASQFSKMYKSCGKKSNIANEEDEEEENENEEDPEIAEPNETSNEINLDYIISLTKEKKYCQNSSSCKIQHFVNPNG